MQESMAWEIFSHGTQEVSEPVNDDERYPYGPVKLLMNTLIILLCVKRDGICTTVKER